MTDQELRDKLASEHDWAIPVHFIEGWNAARANDEEKENLKRTEKVYWMNREAISQLKQERDQLKAAAEKLAEALELLHQVVVLTHPELSSVEMNTITTRQYILAKPAWQALAEYRKEIK